jgi:hypothetical protein
MSMSLSLTQVIAIAVALVLGFILAKLVSTAPVQMIVKSAEDEALDLIEKQIDFIADDSADLKKIAEADKSMANRAARRAQLYAKVAALMPAMPPEPDTSAAKMSTGQANV